MDYPSLFTKLKELGFSFREHDSSTVGFFLIQPGVMGISFDLKVNWKENICCLVVESSVKGNNETLVTSDFGLVLSKIGTNLDKDRPSVSKDDIEAMGIINSIHSLKLGNNERLLVTYPNNAVSTEQVSDLAEAIRRWLGSELSQKTLIISDDIKFTKVGNLDN